MSRVASCGRKNNVTTKYVYVLSCGTCENIRLHDKRSLKLNQDANQLNLK